MDPAASIFIVEDEAIVANDLRETLSTLGYQVAGIAASGETALERIRNSRPDLVLMDIHLSGSMDGIEAAGTIHDSLEIPVIFMTAYADQELLDRAKLTEPFGYLVKPYQERELQSVIQMALYKHKMDRRVRESEATTRLMVNATDDLLYLVGSDGRFLMVNDALAELAGSSALALVGTSAYEMVGKKVLSPRMACWQLDARGEKRQKFEELVGPRWYDVAIRTVFDSKGAPEKYAISARNITAKKLAEEQVRDNAEFFRAMIEESSEVIILLNPDGTFAQPSPSFRSALGFQDEEQMKKSFFDHLHLEDWQQAKKVFHEVRTHPGMARPVHLKFERSDGKVCVIKGILSNLSTNPFVKKIVLNGWVA
jgi:PAS domain S-box-containing protein